MYFYSCSVGNPESTDFSLSLCSEILFNKEDFNDLRESLIIETLEEQYKNKKQAFISSLDTDILVLKFQSKGINLVEETVSYYLEPYWGKDRIKSKELLKWCDGKDDEMDAELKKIEEEV